MPSCCSPCSWDFALRSAATIRSARRAWLLNLPICALPVASFVGLIARAGLRFIGGEPAAMGPELGLFAMGVAAALAAWGTISFPALATKALMLTILSPLTLLTAAIVIRSALNEFPLEIAARVEPTSTPRRELPDVHIVVFDTMGYDEIYADTEMREELPAIRAFAQASDNHHRASAPGPNTLQSMPGLLTGRAGLQIYPTSARGTLAIKTADGIRAAESQQDVFALARTRGYRSAAMGWHLPYCAIWEASLDVCRSFSEVNRSSIEPGFSLLNPIASTIGLWPKGKPFGFLKGAFAGPIFRDLTGATLARAVANLSDPRPLFQLIHFGVPHPPYVFDESGYRATLDPYRETAENYREQTRYADRLFARYLDALRKSKRFDNATILLLSDHEHRQFSKNAHLRAIPLIVKRPGQTEARQRFESVGAERILWEIAGGGK